MRIEASPLYRDIMTVLHGDPVPGKYKYTVCFICGDAQVYAMRMESLYNRRDYVRNAGDEIELIAYFTEQQWRENIIANATTLEVLVTRYALRPGTETVDYSLEGVTERYIATLVELLKPGAGDDNQQNRDPSNTLKRVSFQLTPRGLQELRMISRGGIYLNVTPSNLIRSEFDQVTSKLDLDDAVKPLGVTLAPADIDTPLKSIRIPHGMPLLSIPGFIQNQYNGLYNTGLGAYYQDRFFHIFPLADPTRFGSGPTLTVYRVPPESMPTAINTYSLTSTHLTIVATGDTIHVDPSDHSALNEGNATQFAQAGKLFNSATASQGKVTTNQAETMANFTLATRDTGLNYKPFAQERITDNVARAASSLAVRNMEYMQVGWDHGNPELIVPGMATQVYYLADDEVKRLVGTVVSVEAYTQLVDKGMTVDEYATRVVIGLYVSTPKVTQV